jgi:hypothetical protein
MSSSRAEYYIRIMRHTGKYWTLTVVSALFTVCANVLISFWDEKHTSDFELWFDIIPSGLGVSSIITTTLIVSSSFGDGSQC